jgi:hypothetical protein
MLRWYTSIRPKSCELISVVLLSAGINLLTSVAQARQMNWLGVSAIALTVSGVLLFVVTGDLEELYAAAQRRATQPGFETETLAHLAHGIAEARRAAGIYEMRYVAILLIALLCLATGGVALSAHLAGW